jgi:hypothetical protein
MKTLPALISAVTGAWLATAATAVGASDEIFIRLNQIAYAPREPKLAIGFSREPLPSEFQLVSAQDEHKIFFIGPATPITNAAWGRFNHHAELDFSAFHRSGSYRIKVGDACSLPVCIRTGPSAELPAVLLEFMRQQRCGFNPWLNTNCHQLDGRTAYGPLTNGSPLDATGGWHDAGDMLKYLLTSGNATAQMLLAYELEPRGNAADQFDALGRPGANGIPDLLDEARWGLDWMLKLHPAPGELYHQVADDRDHAGWRLPQNDTADYGWGKGGARVVYFADGQPQGLRQFKSESTGVANLAGRYAAAMALAYQIWKDDPRQKDFAARCLHAGREVFELGQAREGVQQGNSYGAPYRYEECTWADDMEWGAAELFRATGQREYLSHAKRYAALAADDTWMGRAQTKHYQYYPFVNAGHFRLYDLADRQTRLALAGWYREGIERCLRMGQGNPYHVGVPFIWCSDNLVVALVTQCQFYERMTGDRRYRRFAAEQRDWLLGRNPWGMTLFTGLGSRSPRDVHLMTVQLLHRPVRGGLVDGPVYERIFKSLKGVAIAQPDPLADFQGPAVYHDDGRDYSSNEPTMDGTASAILMFVLCP